MRMAPAGVYRTPSSGDSCAGVRGNWPDLAAAWLHLCSRKSMRLHRADSSCSNCVFSSLSGPGRAIAFAAVLAPFAETWALKLGSLAGSCWRARLRMMAATPEYVSTAMAAAAVSSGSGGLSERGEEGSRAMLCAHWRRQGRGGRARASVVGG